jgi:hypothetical protein
MSRLPRSTTLCCALGALLLAPACRCDGKEQDKARPAPGASATPAPAATPSASAKPASSAFPVPVGPALAILPGQGVGAIRFGANTATIERLMEFPCEVKTETLCGYNGRAIDFHLQDGVLDEIHIHRAYRKDTNLSGAEYGVFNGRMLNGVRPEMLQRAVIETLGPPERLEQITDDNPWGTIQRHHYGAMTLEYDKVQSGNTVLGGIVLRAEAQPKPAQ